MQISIADFNEAIRMANSDGLSGREVEIDYLPPMNATQSQGCFVVTQIFRTACGMRVNDSCTNREYKS